MLSLLTVASSVVSSAQPDSQSLLSFVPLIAVFAVFYFLIMRPQQSRYKNHQQMIKAIKKGDQVMTSGGIIGKVVRIDDIDDVAHVEIADSVIIKVSRPTIANIYNGKSAAEVVKKEKSKKAPVANDN